DNNVGTKWLDFANSFPSTRSSWIQYQYANQEQYVVTNYTITSANDAPDRDPADWALLGSNDGGTNWITLDTRTGQVFASRFLSQSYTVPSPGAYNLYRLRIDRLANPGAAVAMKL